MKVKKILIIVLILIIPIIMMTFSKSNVKIDEPKKLALELFEEERVDSLKRTFGADYESKIENSNLSNKIANMIKKEILKNNLFKDSYAGMYIKENGKLVMQLVKDNYSYNNLKSNKAINSYINNNQVTIEYVNNTYEDLEYVNNIIVNYFLTNGVKNCNFVGNYIDEISNSVIVELKNNTIEEQNIFKKEVVDSKLLKFEKGERGIPTASYKTGAGYRIEKSIYSGGNTTFTGHNCSIGFRAKLNGKVGFVTAGHCVVKTFYGTTYDRIDVTIGTVKKSIFNQSMDAAFIELKSGDTISQNFEYPGMYATFLNTTNPYYTTGALIGKVGVTTHYQSGTLQSTNYSITDSKGMYHTGLVRTTAYIQEGDSGGPIFLEPNKVEASKGAQLVAISSIGANDKALGYPATKVVSDLGVTKY